MDSVILSGTVNHELKWIAINNSTGLIPLINKPLVCYGIDAIQQTGSLENLYFNSDDDVESLLNTLSAVLDEGINPKRYRPSVVNPKAEQLCIRDDVVYDLDFTNLLQQLRASKAQSTVLMQDYYPVGFYQKNASQLPLAFKQGMTTQQYCLELLNNQVWENRLDITSQAYYIVDLYGYYEISMRLLQSKMKHAVVDYHQMNNRLIKGQQVNLTDMSYPQDCHHAYVGDHVYVHNQSKLHGEVVLCQNSYIDEHVDIKDSIIMPGVYVGSYLNISHAIVTGNAVIQIANCPIKVNMDKKISCKIVED